MLPGNNKFLGLNPDEREKALKKMRNRRIAVSSSGLLLLLTLIMGFGKGCSSEPQAERVISTSLSDATSVSVNDPAPAETPDSTYFFLGKISIFGGQHMSDSLELLYSLANADEAPRIAMKIAGVAYALERKLELCGCPATTTVQVKTGGGGSPRLATNPSTQAATIYNITNITNNNQTYDNPSYVWNLIGGDPDQKAEVSVTPPTVTAKDSTKKRNFPQTQIWGGAFGGMNLGGYYTGIEIGPAEIEHRGATGGRSLRDSILRTQYANISGRVALVNQPNLRVAFGATGTQLYQRQLITTISSFEDFVDGRRFAGTDTLPGIVGKTAFYAGPSASLRVNVGEKVSLYGDIDYQFRTGGTAQGPNGFLNGNVRAGFEPFPGATVEVGAGYQYNTPVATGGIVIDLNKLFSNQNQSK